MFNYDYDVLDDFIPHEDCIQIPYPCIGWAWFRLFYNPADKSFFCDQYSTGVIDDCEIRYHGSEPVSLGEVIASLSKEWPDHSKGKRVLNEILAKDFPDVPLLTIEEEQKEPEPEPENLHQEVWGI